MADLPEFVYLVTVNNEWPVSAIADCHPDTASIVEREVARRRASGNVTYPEQVRVWKAHLTDIRKVDLLPSVTTKPALRERIDG